MVVNFVKKVRNMLYDQINEVLNIYELGKI